MHGKTVTDGGSYGHLLIESLLPDEEIVMALWGAGPT